MKAGLYKSAIFKFNGAIEVNPNEFGAYLGRGYSYFKLHLYNRAVDDLRRATELAPEIAELIFKQRRKARFFR